MFAGDQEHGLRTLSPVKKRINIKKLNSYLVSGVLIAIKYMSC